jgi:hypothetical protein
MNIQQLMEGLEPKMPGAPKGIQIMTPQQFVAKAGDEKTETEVDEDWFGRSPKKLSPDEMTFMLTIDGKPYHLVKGHDKASDALDTLVKQQSMNPSAPQHKWGMTLYTGEPVAENYSAVTPTASNINPREKTAPVTPYGNKEREFRGAMAENSLDEFAPPGGDDREPNEEEVLRKLAAQWWNGTEQQMDKAQKTLEVMGWEIGPDESGDDDAGVYVYRIGDDDGRDTIAFRHSELGLDEGQQHLLRIRELSGLDEATKLPAQSRPFGGDEFQDYMKRIVGTPDVDKKTGKVKVDKKGIEKYVSGKTKTDRYKMPYIHRSSVIEYLGPDGKTYSEDKIKQALADRPKKLLKQNEKMKHSNGELEQFFNVGFAALTGIALDEGDDKLIIVNTCPGAGSCKVDCFAMKGGKVQFKAAWLSDGRILTYLLNDPDGFFNQLSNEITKEEAAGKKGGYTVTIRWHDAGDFFSPEYLDLALKMAAKHPDTKFYAYTKMAGAALAKKPDNFIINWSEGAHTSQEKQVKAQDKDLETTKNSRIVPDEIFQDLLVKDAKKNLVKGPEGQWQVQPDKLPELKQRLAKQYGLSANSILNYDEYMAKRKSIPAGMKYNVIVAPGEGDISANDPNIISTLLLKH